MKNFKSSLSGLIGAAVVAVASVAPEAQAQQNNEGNKLAQPSSLDLEVARSTRSVSSALEKQYKKQLERLGVEYIEITKSNTSADGKKVTFTINFIKTENENVEYVADIEVDSSMTNKYALLPLFNDVIAKRLEPKTSTLLNQKSGDSNQSATATGGNVSINASGAASVSIDTKSDKRSTSSLSVNNGRVFLNGKDVTPDGVSGSISIERSPDGQYLVNGKPIKNP